MESLIRDVIVEHLSRHSLIRSFQHGFMAGRSTLTNFLAYMQTLIKLLDDGHAVDVHYVVSAKTIDKVPQSVEGWVCEESSCTG